MATGRIEINRDLCKGCGLCQEACPRDLITSSSEANVDGYFPASFEDEPEEATGNLRCTACTACGLVCPEVAIRVYKQDKA